MFVANRVTTVPFDAESLKLMTIWLYTIFQNYKDQRRQARAKRKLACLLQSVLKKMMEIEQLYVIPATQEGGTTVCTKIGQESMKLGVKWLLTLIQQAQRA